MSGGQVKEFVGTRRLRSLQGTAASLVFAVVPVVLWLTHDPQPPRTVHAPANYGGPWVWGAFLVATLLYYSLIAVRRSVVKLDDATLIAGGITFPRAGLTVEVRRWIDDSNGSGTTEGTALLLRQGKHHLAIGCKGTAPTGDVGVTADVKVVLSAPDLHDLFVALRPDAATGGSNAGGGLTIHVGPSPSSAGRRLWRVVPFWAAVGLAALLGNHVVDRSAMKVVNEIGVPAAVVIAALAVSLWRRPAPANLLHVEGGRVSYRDGRSGQTLAACALRDLRVERARYVSPWRGRFEYPVLTVWWPDRRPLVIGANEWRGPLDPGLPRRLFAPPFLIGAGEWDALDRELRPWSSVANPGR